MSQTFTLADHQFMARAISLAKKGHYSTTPNPRVGCVLVKNGKIIGEGYHIKAGQGHAEVNALAQARLLGENAAEGATAYVTLEPCSHYGRTPPCAEGLIKAKVNKVIAAMVDPNPQVSGRGLKMIADAGIETASGLLENDAKALNKGFLHLMQTGMPYVRCKLAASLDGKTAMASGESKWITSSLARANVQALRAQSCAIISGAASVITDQAKMTVRHSELGELAKQISVENLRQPVRVIIDSQNRLTPNLPLFSETSPILLIRKQLDTSQNWPAHVEELTVATKVNQAGQERIDLQALLVLLGKRGFNDVLVESGQQLAGAFIAQDLVNELVLFLAPKLLGSDGKSLLAMPELVQLSQAKTLQFTEMTMVGPDLKITATLQEKK